MDLFKTKQRTAESVAFPHSTFAGLRRHHPDLTDGEVQLVADGLRQWYRVAQLAGPRSISMPSKVVDDLWHEHITCTRDYAGFCRSAFGRFLHHQPESGMSSVAASLNQGFWLRETWDLARRAQGGGTPLLFGIDEQLGIEGGKRYVESCGSSGSCTGGFSTCIAHLPSHGPTPPRRTSSSSRRSGASSFGGACGAGSSCGSSSSCGASSGCGGGGCSS